MGRRATREPEGEKVAPPGRLPLLPRCAHHLRGRLDSSRISSIALHQGGVVTPALPARAERPVRRGHGGCSPLKQVGAASARPEVWCSPRMPARFQPGVRRERPGTGDPVTGAPRSVSLWPEPSAAEPGVARLEVAAFDLCDLLLGRRRFGVIGPVGHRWTPLVAELIVAHLPLLAPQWFGANYEGIAWPAAAWAPVLIGAP